MMVVGEEGTSIDDFILYLKSEFLDAVYLQQNGFDKVDAASNAERQKYVYNKVHKVLMHEFSFKTKDETREFFYKLRQNFIDWNYLDLNSKEVVKQEKVIDEMLNGKLDEVAE